MNKDIGHNLQNLSTKQLRNYISDKNTLSYEQTLWLFRKDPSKRTENDIKQLVESNLALVYSVVLRHLRKHDDICNKQHVMPFNDLFSAGIIGLNKAIVKYDSRKETKFSTYAHYWISASVREEIRRLLYPLKTYSYAKVVITEYEDRNQSSSSTSSSSTNVSSSVVVTSDKGT